MTPEFMYGIWFAAGWIGGTLFTWLCAYAAFQGNKFHTHMKKRDKQ